MQELRRSRLRIVEAADDARRRLERDLHDGAQQQLVSLALDLRLLRARLGDHEAAELVDNAAARLADALAELRELARGIHPAILSERGLEPAVEVLAERCPIPIDWTVDLDERLAAVGRGGRLLRGLRGPDERRQVRARRGTRRVRDRAATATSSRSSSPTTARAAPTWARAAACAGWPTASRRSRAR